MNWAARSKQSNPKTWLARATRGDWMIAALFLMMAASLPGGAQQAPAQQAPAQQGSLGDIARQARAQKQGQPSAETSQAQQVADELSEDQNDNGAPGGFKTYNAGDYKLWVPAPYIVEGHDDAGVVLAGPNVGSKRPIVLVGTPIVAHPENSDDAFHDAATQFAHLYAQSANCAKTMIAERGAYQCSMAAATLLGRRVSGNAVFVRGSANIYPVFCVTPTDSRSRDMLNNSRARSGAKEMARESLDREEDDVKTVWQKCDTVFQSIQIRDGAATQKAAADSSKASAVTAKPAAVAAASAQSAEPAAGSTIPGGFKVQAFNYCKNSTLCWDASVLVPTDAKLVSSNCKQYVFEIKVQGAPFLLLAGGAGPNSCTGRSANDPSHVQWKQLVDPETARAPGTSSTISAQQMTLEGQPTVITKIRFKNGFADWIAKRAEVEDNGAQLVVGCMAPKETFENGDAVCTGLIESLRLP
ncbi:MAG TPA: hypothetical protein VIW68_02805 [Candidatus Sulfotelmatobacter sp.]